MLKHLLFWPITGPSFLARFSLGKVQETVREQLTDDALVKQDLLALQMELELGEIDDAEYVAREAELMERLREVRYWREQFGMGTSGGPVQVARDAAPAEADEEEAGPVDVEPADPDDAEEGTRRGGIASPEGASIEFNFDWEE